MRAGIPPVQRGGPKQHRGLLPQIPDVARDQRDEERRTRDRAVDPRDQRGMAPQLGRDGRRPVIRPAPERLLRPIHGRGGPAGRSPRERGAPAGAADPATRAGESAANRGTALERGSGVRGPRRRQGSRRSRQLRPYRGTIWHGRRGGLVFSTRNGVTRGWSRASGSRRNVRREMACSGGRWPRTQ